MNISMIKQKAQELLVGCKPQVMRIMLILMLIEFIPSLLTNEFDGFALVSIIQLLFITVSHGYVVTSIKIARNNAQALNDNDALVGLKRFKELFFTYFLVFLFTFLILIIPTIILIVLIVLLLGNSMLSTGLYAMIGINDPISQLVYTMMGSPLLLFFTFLSVVAVFVLWFIVELYFFATPYLMEQYHYTGMNAIKESMALMKGHKWELFKLEFSFFGWVLLSVVIQQVIVTFIGFIPIIGYLTAIAASGLISVYTYLPKYHVSLAIFFEELAYYKYENKAEETQFHQ